MSNLVITGFMGTGKTAVGRAVARSLKRKFVDMDEEIVARAGISVSAIFEQQGEPSFRRMESDLARELAQEDGLVIATGGGTLVSDENRAALSRNGVIVCLTASVDAILRRVQKDKSRPLLEEGEKRARIAALLAEREHAYALLPARVDTTDQPIAAVVEAVVHHYLDRQCKPSTSR